MLKPTIHTNSAPLVVDVCFCEGSGLFCFLSFFFFVVVIFFVFLMRMTS